MKKTRCPLLTIAITIIFFLPEVFSHPTYSAQLQVVDSLENLLETQPLTNAEQIRIFRDIINKCGTFDMKKTIKYGKKGLALAEKEKDKKMMMWFCISNGVTYDVLSKHDSAFIYYDKAQVLVEETKDRAQEAILYRCISNSYYKQDKYAKALEYCMKVLHISEITGDEFSQITALTNIGSLHREMNNPNIALLYLEKANVLQNQDTPGHVLGYEFGLIYLDQEKLDLALEYELRAVAHFHTSAYAPMECYALEALAKIYLKKKDYAQAMDYANQCLNLATELGDKQIQGDAWSVMSDIFLEQKRYKETETMALKAWNVDSLSLKSGHHIAYNIALSNLFLDNKEKAAAFFEKYNDILKRYNDKNFHETFAGMEVQYETEKKELRISVLEKEKIFYIWLSIAGVAILLLALGLLLFRHRLIRQKVQQLEQEKQIIAAQSVLEGETEERKRVAEELHDGLGAMLSVVKLNLSDIEHIQNARDLLDRSISELRRIAHHMMPESLLRYGLKVSLEDFSLSVPNMKFHYFGDDNRLDNKMEVLIYRCVHELVNNAIKYSGAENINVQLVRDDDRVSLTIQDDGCGFDVETPTEGTGLKNLRNRVTTYNGNLNIYSSPGKGTEVYVDISLK